MVDRAEDEEDRVQTHDAPQKNLDDINKIKSRRWTMPSHHTDSESASDGTSESSSEGSNEEPSVKKSEKNSELGVLKQSDLRILSYQDMEQYAKDLMVDLPKPPSIGQRETDEEKELREKMEEEAAAAKTALASQSVTTSVIEKYESDEEIERPGNMSLVERIEIAANDFK